MENKVVPFYTPTPIPNKEIPPKGGQSTEEVVKIGTTVRQTKYTNHEFIHGILQYLEKQKYRYSKSGDLESILPSSPDDNSSILEVFCDTKNRLIYR